MRITLHFCYTKVDWYFHFLITQSADRLLLQLSFGEHFHWLSFALQRLDFDIFVPRKTIFLGLCPSWYARFLLTTYKMGCCTHTSWFITSQSSHLRHEKQNENCSMFVLCLFNVFLSIFLGYGFACQCPFYRPFAWHSSLPRGKIKLFFLSIFAKMCGYLI